MATPGDFLYSKEHEWAKFEAELVTIGITDHAQNSLGDIVYVELPKIGATLDQFSNVGVVESVKAVSDLFTPVGGEVVEVNSTIESDPGLVNREPYANGWLFKVKTKNADAQKASLLSAQAYDRLVKEQ